MYWIEDKSAAIKNIQRLLGVNQTGFYDTVTKDAVVKIQKSGAREKTGVIDFGTFELIVDEYNKRKRRYTKENYLFMPRFPYRMNDLGENISMIHKALKPVLLDYIYEGAFPEGAFMNIDTVNAVNFLRKIFDMPLSNEIDEEFLGRLLMEKKAIEVKHGYS